MQSGMEIRLPSPGEVRRHLLKDLEVLSCHPLKTLIAFWVGERLGETVPGAMLNALWCALVESSQ